MPASVQRVAVPVAVSKTKTFGGDRRFECVSAARSPSAATVNSPTMPRGSAGVVVGLTVRSPTNWPTVTPLQPSTFRP